MSAVTEKPSLTLTRRLRASPSKVFRAWTEAEEITRWWGPAGTQTVLAEVDLRVGGRFRKIARSQDGEEHEASGVFREVVRDRKLVLTWAWRSTPERESLLTIVLAPDGDGTLLTLTHEHFADAAARDAHRAGWTGALDKLAAYVASAA